MANSYIRPCRKCGRRISMRQMPHGQWVAFENNEVRDCSEPPKVKVVKPPARQTCQVEAPTEFDDIVIPDQLASKPTICRTAAISSVATTTVVWNVFSEFWPGRSFTTPYDTPRGWRAQSTERRTRIVSDRRAISAGQFVYVAFRRTKDNRRHLHHSRCPSFHRLLIICQPSDLRDHNTVTGLHFLQHRNGHFTFCHGGWLALVLDLGSSELSGVHVQRVLRCGFVYFGDYKTSFAIAMLIILASTGNNELRLTGECTGPCCRD